MAIRVDISRGTVTLITNSSTTEITELPKPWRHTDIMVPMAISVGLRCKTGIQTSNKLPWTSSTINIRSRKEYSVILSYPRFSREIEDHFNI